MQKYVKYSKGDQVSVKTTAQSLSVHTKVPVLIFINPSIVLCYSYSSCSTKFKFLSRCALCKCVYELFIATKESFQSDSVRII